MQPSFAVIVACALLVAGQACALPQSETLLVERARLAPPSAPARGLSMAAVSARYGEPQQRLAPRGGQKRAWPAIHRWVYPDYTVYFEKNRVIDVVVRQAGPDEIGPKPPIR